MPLVFFILKWTCSWIENRLALLYLVGYWNILSPPELFHSVILAKGDSNRNSAVLLKTESIIVVLVECYHVQFHKNSEVYADLNKQNNTKKD